MDAARQPCLCACVSGIAACVKPDKVTNYGSVPGNSHAHYCVYEPFDFYSEAEERGMEGRREGEGEGKG